MADRLSIKWVEGNTNGTTAEVAADTTFNVDQPAMWTPLSVLSGLASGYCERRAVLDSQFVDTVTGTTYTWNQTGTDQASVNTRATVVQNCMHNLAKGSSIEHLFDAADATMSGIGVAGGTNYMTAMDGAIVKLIDTTTVHYVNAAGATYTDFAALGASAVAAATAAQDATSTIQTPQEGGGNTLKAQFAVGLPVEWAKERKWMLNELRFTPNVQYTSGVVDVKGSNSYCSANAGNSYTTVASCKTAILNSAGSQESAQEYEDNPWKLYHYFAVVSGIIGKYTLGRTFGFTMQGAYNNNYTVSKWRPWNNSNYLGFNGAWDEGSLIRPLNSLCLASSTEISPSITSAVVVMEQGSPLKLANQIVWNWTTGTPVASRGIIVSSGVTQTDTSAKGGFYDVRSGGSLKIKGNFANTAILVRNGGYVSMANSTTVNACTIASGGTMEGIPNVASLAMSGMYPMSFTYPVLATNETYTNVVGEGVVSTVTPADNYSASTSRNFYVASGGTLLINAGTYATQNTATVHNIGGNLIIGNGGLVQIVGNTSTDGTDVYTHRMQTDQTIAVLPGGTFSLGMYAKAGWDYYNYGTYRYYMNLCAYPNSILEFDTRGQWDSYWDPSGIYEGGSLIEIGPCVSVNISIDFPRTTHISVNCVLHFNQEETLADIEDYIVVTDYYSGTPTTFDVTTTNLFGATYVCLFTDMGIKAIASGNYEAALIHEGTNVISVDPNDTEHKIMTYGGSITLVEPSKTGIHTGTEQTFLIYRCCIESVLTVDTASVTPDNHYDSFYVRQTKVAGDPPDPSA